MELTKERVGAESGNGVFTKRAILLAVRALGSEATNTNVVKYLSRRRVVVTHQAIVDQQQNGKAV